jgi:hypothetical protein
MTTGQLTAPVAPVPVPSSAQVRELLQTLMSAAVEVAPAAPLLPGRETAVVGVYVTDAEMVGAVVACELPLAAGLGGALGEVPAAEVEQAVAAGGLEGDLVENAAEVLNVLAAAFNGPGAPPLKLGRVHAVGEELPPQLTPVFQYVMCRVDLQVDVAGYGGGRLSLIVAG